MKKIFNKMKDIINFIKALFVFVVAVIFTILFQIFMWIIAIMAIPYLKITGDFEKPLKVVTFFESKKEIKEWIIWFFKKK